MMRVIHRLGFLLFFITTSFYLKAVKIDTVSLKKEINYLALLNSRNIDSALIVAQKLEESLPRIKEHFVDDLHFLYIAQNQIAITYAIKGDKIKSFDYFKRNTELDTSLLSNKEKGTAFNNLAICYMNFGNYSKAVENYFIGLRYREMLGDYSEVAGSYLNIGLCYYRQSMWDEALKYYLLAEEYNAKSDKPNHSVTVKITNNIGLVFLNQKKPDTAERYFDKAVSVASENNFKVELASSYNYYSEVYFLKNDLAKAIEMALKSLEINREIGSDYGVSLTFINLGKFYIEDKKHSLSRQYLDSAKSFFKAQQDLWEMKDIYELYAKNYFSQGNYSMAYLYSDSLIAVKDSIFSKESLNQQINTEAIYGNEKKMLQIQNLEKENQIKATEVKRQNTLKISFAVGFALTLLLVLFVFRMYKQKQKSEALLSAQKEIVEKSHVLLTEKNKEITDSIGYAKRIQEAILPSTTSLKENLNNGFVLFKPKDIVSGDFYWLESPTPLFSSPRQLAGQMSASSGQRGTVYFAAADCTGHGVPGAMVSVVCSNALSKSLLEEGITEPGKILDRTRELVVGRFGKSSEDVKDGMDISLCALQGNKLSWAGANNPLWIINPKRTHWPENTIPFVEGQGGVEIKPNKQPIGKVDNPQSFTTHTIELQKGDTIYIFTDGYQDQFGGDKGKKFKASQLKELLLSIQDKAMDEQKEFLNQAFENWRGNLEQVDDLCIIGVRI